MTSPAARFAALYAVLHTAHHVGDYWIQTDHQARCKGEPGWPGARACAAHVGTYTATTAAAVLAADRLLGLGVPPGAALAGQALSAATHYAADRRAHGLMLPLADKLDRFTHKRAWIDGGGAALMDQAWHLGWLALAALVSARR